LLCLITKFSPYVNIKKFVVWLARLLGDRGIIGPSLLHQPISKVSDSQLDSIYLVALLAQIAYSCPVPETNVIKPAHINELAPSLGKES
jgi:hypothetical protein